MSRPQSEIYEEIQDESQTEIEMQTATAQRDQTSTEGERSGDTRSRVAEEGIGIAEDDATIGSRYVHPNRRKNVEKTRKSSRGIQR